MVPNSMQVEEVVAGPQGIFEGARKGLIIIDMSTIAPSVWSQKKRRRARYSALALQ
jgi:3-hydroxyisobutyrate dehydrogenase-like beta-hydroxyacid dehydrogenase